MWRLLLISLSCFVSLACSNGSVEPASEDAPADGITAAGEAVDGLQVLQPPPEGQGFQLSMEATAPPGSEVWICDIYPLNFDGIAEVNWVEVQQTPGTHHLTLSTLGLTGGGQMDYGRYDCADLYGDSSLMEDQIMFYGNQGVAEEEMHLPDGVSATFPSGLDVIHEMHYVNASLDEVALYSRVNAWTIPSEDVVTGVYGGSVRDEHIQIPPGSEHTEWSRCVMTEDVDILFLASHTHKRGIEFTIAEYDGEEVGEIFYTNTDWHVPKIQQYDPPIVRPAGTGFEWTCTWKNETDETIEYGLTAEDEMCNLAVVFTPFSLDILCEVVETSDGVLYVP